MQTVRHRTENGKSPLPAGLPLIGAGGVGGWILGSLTGEWVRTHEANWAYSLALALAGGLAAHAFHRLRSASSSRPETSAGEWSGAANRIAHDLRSPLAALDMVTGQLNQISEEKKALIRSATDRIRDIANELQLKHDGFAARPATNPSPLLLAGLVDSLITEKRRDLRGRPGLDLDFRLHAESYGIFTSVGAGGIRELLSRLIELSAASISAARRDGRIEVRLRLKPQDATGMRLLLQIRDNGDQPIPESALAELRRTASSWAGELQLLSQRYGHGSTLTLELPREKAPGWFVPQVEFSAGGTVIIADDDASVHQMWEGRFRSTANERTNSLPSLAHASTLEELRKLASSEKGAKADLLLIDYEFMGESRNGLDVIEELGLADRAVLVTSRFEEAHVRERCERLKVRVVPKSMSGFVPLRTKSRISITRPGFANAAPTTASPSAPQALPRIDAILIDDDELVHMTWKIAAGREHKVILTFRSVDEFLSIPGLLRLPQTTAIFVDSNLGNGVRGEQAAKALHDRGFRNISLATGYAGQREEKMPEWIRRVVGKDPVFE